ncbi:hypothetical protein PCANC_19729 [Puccinia coronata f. sp. avenae]|uniref:Uncharacterized protein n=1 Tax=Puccinia coronata f. sp. avenae TaxID=200324 RepID=A0A2N5TRN2_9BASI|nr:hypothetical protein PCANC_19729 [Puccinia coronata f. sp. avenae]
MHCSGAPRDFDVIDGTGKQKRGDGQQKRGDGQPAPSCRQTVAAVCCWSNSFRLGGRNEFDVLLIGGRGARAIRKTAKHCYQTATFAWGLKKVNPINT